MNYRFVLIHKSVAYKSLKIYELFEKKIIKNENIVQS